ncbi:MAG: ribonuclease PH [Chloroflexi bacterium]|nr:MAG: ribonuclease PH [Chloroflexota bacterium]
MARHDGRAPDEIRPVEIIPNYLKHAEGSAFIKMGNTWVLCAASVEERVPRWVADTGHGWVTATYNLLPRATHSRTERERQGAGGRTREIERLIGRSLRAAVNLPALGEQMITVDCDVIQADGGTRTASITGGYVALAIALYGLIARRAVSRRVIQRSVAAISAGVVQDEILLDLDYQEDYEAAVDFNVVMTDQGDLVEVQGTAEGKPFSPQEMNELVRISWKGIQELLAIQQEALRQALER